MQMIDSSVYIVGILGPVASLPQLYKIYASHSAAGIAVVTWVLWAIFDVPWIAYGVAHKETPITVTYTLWFILNILIALGAVLYG